MRNECCVYTISEGPLGPTKIGTTASDARFGALQTGNPRLLNAGISLPCQHAKDIERRVHARLAYRRLKGEWFDVTPEEAEAAIDAVIRQRCGPRPANDQPSELKALASRVLRRAEAATLRPEADTSSAASKPKPRAKPSVAPAAPVATHPSAHQWHSSAAENYEVKLTEAQQLAVLANAAQPVVRNSMAPPGVCVYCDHRRAKVAEAVRLHRARKQ